MGDDQQPGPRGVTVDRVAGGLRDGILNNRYAPGQRLIEAELTRDFGVSRGPLREAFRRLDAEGLLEIIPHRGALVRKLSFEETLELLQIRHALEPLAACLAAEGIEMGGNRQRFESAVAPIWSEAPRLDASYHKENRRFHLSIFEICGNSQLIELGRQLQLPLLMLQLSPRNTPEIYRASVLEHRKIATAILCGDSEAAEMAMRQHLDWGLQNLHTMPRSMFRGYIDS